MAHILDHRERELLVRRARSGWSPQALVVAHGVSRRTVYRLIRGERPSLEARVRNAVDRWAERRGVELAEGDAASLARAIEKLVQHDRGAP